MAGGDTKAADAKAQEEAIKKRVVDLRQVRGTNKGFVTKLESWVESESGDVYDIEARLDSLENQYRQFLLTQAELESHNYLAEFPERESFDARVIDLRAKLKRLRAKKAAEEGLETSHIAENLLNQTASTQPVHVELNSPELVLPKIKPYSGDDYMEYPIFKNSFLALVDSAKARDLSKLRKFGILRESLSGRAYEAIQHLLVTNENYDRALQILDERFLKPRLIFDSLIKRLIDIPKVSGLEVLRKTLDNIKANLNALQGLPATNEQIGFGLLIHYVLTKVDQSTAVKWNEESCLKGSEIPKWSEFDDFLTRRANMMEAMSFLNHKKDDKPRGSQSSRKTYTAGPVICIMCSGTCKTLADCQSFMAKEPKDRYAWVKANHHCVRCLIQVPHPEKCKAPRCQICKGRHHSLLHFGEFKNEKPLPTVTENPAKNTPPKGAFTVNQQGGVDRLQILATAMVKLQARDGSWFTARALIDGGSMTHFLTKRLASKLGLKLNKQNSPVVGLFGGREIRHSSVVKMKSIYGSGCEEELHALILPEFNHLHPSNKINTENIPIPSNINLADPTFDNPQRVDVLIGVGLAYKILMVGQVQIGQAMLLQKTSLGWIVVGEYCSNCLDSNKFSFTASQTSAVTDDNLDQALRKFWDIETIPAPKPNWSSSERFCEEHFVNNTTRAADGKFIVKLPFMTSPSKLGDSLSMARSRLISVERKLTRDPTFNSLYRDFMNEYEALGHMETIQTPGSRYNLLPHHGVLRLSSTSTKLRVVFDASAVTSSGYSLNDLMPHGPTIQPPLFIIMLRFRFHKYYISGDVCKMYRQIWVHPDDQNFQCVLWRDEPTQPLVFKRLKTVTYGTSSAPFLACRVLVELANLCSQKYPVGAKVLREDFYVDNMMSGGVTNNEVLQKYHEVTDILLSAGMEMKKWYTNAVDVRQMIPQENLEKTINIGNDEVAKSLGLVLNLETDEFIFPFEPLDQNIKWTKRRVVSQIAKIFDPLGFYSPVVAKLKIFLQHLWKSSLHWDESLPQSMLTAWLKLLHELPLLADYKIPRYVHYDDDDVTDLQLHCFADASGQAYGAVFYLRGTLPDDTVFMRLLVAKSKVAPLKKITLARLELMGALLLSELYTWVLPALNERIKNVYCWLDSQVALTWVLNSPHRYEDFIAARTTIIQERTAGCSWRHVKGIDNPADILSRGATPKAIIKTHEWLNGPEFLRRDPERWQVDDIKPLSEDDPRLESRKLTFMLYNKLDVDLVASYKYHNDIVKTQRTFAYIARFLNRKSPTRVPTDVNLTAAELETGLQLAVKIIQAHNFYAEYDALKNGREIPQKSSLIRLSPFIDKEGVMRVGGRLSHAFDLHYDERHPMLLPKGHPFTAALFYYYHWKTLHTGPQALLAAVRRKFWPLGGRVLANKTYKDCIPCKIFARRTYKQVMADLPPERVQPFERCFEVVGVDLCGPFTIKHYGRGTPRSTMHIAVFVCFRTKAVNLQYVMGTDTDSIINALIRFIAQSGNPRTIWSDNGTNFHGAHGVLEKVDWKKVDTWCRNTHRIEWKFIPARSPHHGGLWEAAVKSAKKHLYKVMQNTVLHQDAFITLLSRIEVILNNRPCMPLAINPLDGQPLTPSHFKNGGPILELPDPSPSEFTSSRRSLVETWLHITEIKQHWVRRWLTDVRQQLQNREKWHSGSPKIKVGQIVMMVDPMHSPYSWTSARISKVFPGRDNRIRVVEVTTQINGKEKATYQRAITELVPIFTEPEIQQ